MVAALKEKNSDIVLMSIAAGRAAAIMKQMMAAGITPAPFITSRIDAIPAEISNAWPNAIYQQAWDRLPEAYNDRLH